MQKITLHNGKLLLIDVPEELKLPLFLHDVNSEYYQKFNNPELQFASDKASHEHRCFKDKRFYEKALTKAVAEGVEIKNAVVSQSTTDPEKYWVAIPNLLMTIKAGVLYEIADGYKVNTVSDFGSESRFAILTPIAPQNLEYTSGHTERIKAMNEPKQLTPLSELIEFLNNELSKPIYQNKKENVKDLTPFGWGVFDAFGAIKEKAQSLLPKEKEQRKEIAVKFFYHWWNTPGNNTEQGFDDWYEKYNSPDK